MPTTSYKHTQIGYFTLGVMLIILGFFAQAYLAARAEPSSVDSGTNALVTFVMIFIIFILASFATLTVSIQETDLTIQFGYGIFRKRFSLTDIVSARSVKNHWYYGWGIRFWLWPKMWIYNVSGFDAVEIIFRNGSVYRIGTDTPDQLESAIKQSLST